MEPGVFLVSHPGALGPAAPHLGSAGGLADGVLFFLEFGGEFLAFADELFLDLLAGFVVALFGGLGEFAFEEDFALGDLGGVAGVEVGEFGFLGGGDFGLGALFVEPFQGEF